MRPDNTVVKTCEVGLVLRVAVFVEMVVVEKEDIVVLVLVGLIFLVIPKVAVVVVVVFSSVL